MSRFTCHHTSDLVKINTWIKYTVISVSYLVVVLGLVIPELPDLGLLQRLSITSVTLWCVHRILSAISNESSYFVVHSTIIQKLPSLINRCAMEPFTTRRLLRFGHGQPASCIPPHEQHLERPGLTASSSEKSSGELVCVERFGWEKWTVWVERTHLTLSLLLRLTWPR